MSQLSSVIKMLWTTEQRAFAVETYFSRGGSIVAVQRAFRLRYEIPPRGAVPARGSILSWVEAFRAVGSVSRRRPGATRTVRTPANIEAVRESILRSPRRSARKHAATLRLSDRSVRRILHDELHFHPYKMVVAQELSQRDFVARQTACETFIDTLPHDALVFFSDEAHFHLSGCVNRQNMRYWSGINPRELYQRPLHSDRVTVWCALSRVGIIGPYFFEEDNRTVTVNSERYMAMIENFFLPSLENMDVGEVWFQQDGATAHTSRISMRLLRETFPGRLISNRGDIPWPARSPDLAPCDFFLWGYLKSIVYNNRPATLEALKNNIRDEIANIPVAMLERVDRHFRNRLQQCIDSNGRHLSNILFKTT